MNCPICNATDSIYIEKNENVTPIEETRFCTNCGYQTNSNFKIDSKEIELLESGNPKLINELKFADSSLNQFWYPIILNMQGQFLVFPDGTSKDAWKWAFANFIPIEIFDRVNYPIEGRDGEFYEYRLDVDHIQHFDTFNEIYAKLNTLMTPVE